jgi:ribonuclease Z
VSTRVLAPARVAVCAACSTVEQAAETAARAGAKTLVLTHYVPPLVPGTEDQWRALAAAHFGGEIVLGDDLTSVSAP